jgi:hypothetical protein
MPAVPDAVDVDPCAGPIDLDTAADLRDVLDALHPDGDDGEL